MRGSFEDDLELAHEAARGSDAFAAFYRRYVTSVYRYLMARTADVQVAQDLTAEVFLIALCKIHTYRGQGTLIAWLLSIAHHALIDHYRREHAGVPLEDIEDEPAPGLPLDDMVDLRLDQARVLCAIRQLNTERAEALVLRVVLELSVEETALVMGKSEGATKMLVRRALDDLRYRLAKRAEVNTR